MSRRLAPRRMRGVALIQALLIVAAISAVAVALLVRVDRAQERLQWRATSEQAALYLASGVEFLRSSLPRETVHEGQDWARARPPLDIDRGTLGWQVRDLQGRFNLSLLQEDEGDVYAAAFTRLAEEAGLSGEATTAIIGRVAGIDGPLPLILPDLLPDLMAADLDDADLEAWETLRPQIAAWAGLPMNVNTMPRAVLDALLPEIPADQRRMIHQRVRDEPVEELDDLVNWAVAQLGEAAAQQLMLLPLAGQSRLFAADLEARLDSVTLRRSVVIDTGAPEGDSAVRLSLPGP
ncbi:general secretion pathway protein GspK [Rhodobacter sp. NTK016B]|uniref:general secretion pathway protein GspK n=1 Tax=Rhodobacter sp. NTK016B TaxID=2759676 RepID=UPI001A8F2E2C|nr:type II secretion system protein GspK [Rhodobacter sp. NTK016B]MBN8292966.1 general secretion pathway protein GspK [Rhodobacter sp. NTK016B]